jgi:hypothetical protein
MDGWSSLHRSCPVEAKCRQVHVYEEAIISKEHAEEGRACDRAAPGRLAPCRPAGLLLAVHVTSPTTGALRPVGLRQDRRCVTIVADHRRLAWPRPAGLTPPRAYRYCIS